MAQGNYDHPSYLCRQQIALTNTAGASGTSGYTSFISDMRFRKASVTVRTAGTSSGAGNEAFLLCIGTYMTGFSTGLLGTALTTTTGTNTVGTLAVLGSSVAGVVVVSTDMDFRLVAGSTLALKNGTDATGVYEARLECYLDPGATWTGPNN
jgi:hypothetical protein